jgi:myb proto-oncogene protein
MPERTDNDIKNYWNTHLKKKFTKTGGGGGAEAKSGRCAAPKGQWERRLQTDIHTARQALREALSLDPDPVPPSAKPEQVPQQPPAPAATQAAGQATYASSAENIARLLEGWMHPGGGSGAAGKVSSGSRSSASSVSAFSGDEGASASNSGTAVRMPERPTRTSKAVDDAGTAGPGPSFSMLESWLLDDGVGHGDTGLVSVPLGDPCEFF